MRAKYLITRLSLVLFTVLVAPVACKKGGDGGGGIVNPPVTTFVNPLIKGSDPWIFKKDRIDESADR